MFKQYNLIIFIKKALMDKIMRNKPKISYVNINIVVPCGTFYEIGDEKL